MPIGRATVIGLGLIVSITSAQAQHSPSGPESARAQIHSTLRAFYFNLAHHHWEALTADILAAKVVAHRPVPESLVIGAIRHPAPNSSGFSSPATECSPSARALVEQATITLEGDWAVVSVRRCTAALTGRDEFRLIKFEERWRIVYLQLFREPINVSADR
jgi:hypothetical protein